MKKKHPGAHDVETILDALAIALWDINHDQKTETGVPVRNVLVRLSEQAPHVAALPAYADLLVAITTWDDVPPHILKRAHAIAQLVVDYGSPEEDTQ